jgi:hypothetical protein
VHGYACLSGRRSTVSGLRAPGRSRRPTGRKAASPPARPTG